MLLQLRKFLETHKLHETQIYAKVETVEVSTLVLYQHACIKLIFISPNKNSLVITYVNFTPYTFNLVKWSIFLSFLLVIFQGLKHFDEILQEVNGIILSRGNLGIDLPPEKVRIAGRAYS